MDSLCSLECWGSLISRTRNKANVSSYGTNVGWYVWTHCVHWNVGVASYLVQGTRLILVAMVLMSVGMYGLTVFTGMLG